MLHILPAMCTGGISGGGAAPAFTGAAVATEVTPIACGGGWTINVAWSLDFFNDAAYEIRVKTIGGTILASGLLTSGSPYLASPTDTGDPLFTGEMHSAQYTVELLRSIDSVVIDSVDSNIVSVETGPAC